jgi:hypothetical protein
MVLRQMALCAHSRPRWSLLALVDEPPIQLAEGNHHVLFEIHPEPRAGAREGTGAQYRRDYSVGTVLTTDRISRGGLHSAGSFFSTIRSLGVLTSIVGGSAWARVD